MKFCPECGAKLVSQKFCAECGEDLRKYTGQGGEGVGGLGSFDFSALGADTQAQLQEQTRCMADFDIQDGVLVKYKGSESNVVIPNSVTSINDAFYDCESLTSITIPNSVTRIGRDAFSGWGSDQTIYIPSGRGWKNILWTSAEIIEY